MNTEISFEIIEHIGNITEHPTGWIEELNIVRWYGGDLKFDIRAWDKSHEHMRRGITLYPDEMKTVYNLLRKYYQEAE